MSQEETFKPDPFDPAALAGAAVAGAIVSFLNPGPFEWMSVPIGVTLLTIIAAYETGRRRSRPQTLALAAVTSFVSLLIIGFLLELVLGHGSVNGVCNNPTPCKSREYESAVPNQLLASIWAALTIFLFFSDAQIQSRRRSHSSMPSAPGSDTMVAMKVDAK